MIETLQPDMIAEVPRIVLEHGSPLEHWANAEFFKAVESRIKSVLGLAAFMMIVTVPAYLALYYWSRSYVLPTTVLVLSGGVFLAMLPPEVARIGTILILLAGGIGVFGALWAVYR